MLPDLAGVKLLLRSDRHSGLRLRLRLKLRLLLSLHVGLPPGLLTLMLLLTAPLGLKLRLLDFPG